MNELNPYRTIRKKADKWAEWIDWKDDYNGQAMDSVIFLVESYGMDKKEWEKMTKFLDVIDGYDGVRYSWNYRDDVYIDYEDNCAYNIGYDEADVIFLEAEHIGKRQFEKGDMTFDDVSDEFVNNSQNALPSWLEPTDGWEERSCDFASGWYGRNDKPEEILEKLNEQELDVIFQIGSVNMFETRFCVWTKERV